MRHLVAAAILVGGLALQGTFAVVASASCGFTRIDERPRCCKLASMTRLTRVGGDCCRQVLLDVVTPAAGSSLGCEVPPAAAIRLPAHALGPVEDAPVRSAALVARAPPPSWHPNDTEVLLR